jgi:hypothetical protein
MTLSELSPPDNQDRPRKLTGGARPGRPLEIDV